MNPSKEGEIMNVNNCRHCHEYPINRPAKLCWRCYYRPGIKELYPSTSKYRNRGVGNGNIDAPLPEIPTSAMPGTPEKVTLLCKRAEAGVQLWHPFDAAY